MSDEHKASVCGFYFPGTIGCGKFQDFVVVGWLLKLHLVQDWLIEIVALMELVDLGLFFGERECFVLFERLNKNSISVIERLYISRPVQFPI